MRHTRGTLAKRIAALESREPRSTFITDRDEAGWLALYEQLAADGHFDDEPEFPAALERYRDALESATASADPPFEPPAAFLPGQRDPYLRALYWRSADRFPSWSPRGSGSANYSSAPLDG